MHCDEKLVLVGKGSEEERIKNFVKEHNLEGRVQVNGAIFGEEMDRIIERAKVVLVPSEWYENGAFVALQALAKGKIVVASDIAGLSEIVQDGETGYLAERAHSSVCKKAMRCGKLYRETLQNLRRTNKWETA